MDDTGSTDELNEESLKLNIPSETIPQEEAEKPKKEKENESNPETKFISSSPSPSSRNTSDIFFLEADKPTSPPRPSNQLQPPRRINKLRDHTSTIFPAGCMGCREDPPSDHVASPRRFLDAVEAKDYIGHIDNTPRKRPSSAKPFNSRNPLTGVGVNSDEIKRHSSRKKDGNPLLGEGYENKIVTPSSTRIPPGGYSQGLW